jgi:hypothetical protein
MKVSVFVERDNLRPENILVEGGTTAEIEWSMPGLSEYMSENGLTVAMLYTNYGVVNCVIDGDAIYTRLPLSVTSQTGHQPFTLMVQDTEFEAATRFAMSHGDLVVSESPSLTEPIQGDGLLVLPPDSYGYLGSLWVDLYPGQITPEVGPIQIVLSTKKAWVPGQFLSFRSPTSSMVGEIVSYNAITGDSTVNVINAVGGESSAWTIGLTARPTEHDLLVGISGGAAGDRQHLSTDQVNKLEGLRQNVRPDWNEADETSDAHILNKPGHNDLAGVTGGAAGDRQHLSTDQVNKVELLSTQPGTNGTELEFLASMLRVNVDHDVKVDHTLMLFHNSGPEGGLRMRFSNPDGVAEIATRMDNGVMGWVFQVIGSGRRELHLAETGITINQQGTRDSYDALLINLVRDGRGVVINALPGTATTGLEIHQPNDGHSAIRVEDSDGLRFQESDEGLVVRTVEGNLVRLMFHDDGRIVTAPYTEV